MRPKPYEIVCHSSDRERWLFQRCRSIGASDKLTPSLIKQKLADGEVSYTNRKMQMGSILERAAILGFQTWSGLRTRPSGVMVRSKQYPFMHATLDGLCMMPKRSKQLQFFLETEMQMDAAHVASILADRRLAVLEVKVPDIFSLHRWGHVRLEHKKVGDDMLSYHVFVRLKDEPPKMYMTQVQHQLAVTGFEAAWLVALIGGKTFVAHYIVRNEAMITERIRRCAEMWSHIEKAREQQEIEDQATFEEIMQMQ